MALGFTTWGHSRLEETAFPFTTEQNMSNLQPLFYAMQQKSVLVLTISLLLCPSYIQWAPCYERFGLPKVYCWKILSVTWCLLRLNSEVE